MDVTLKIPNDIKARLDEIAEHLWMEPSHACLMVGAGMSKNAEKIDPYSADALSWTELADKMQEHILGIDVVPNKRKYYANVLDVADQLEAVVKKGEMNRFLEQNIPDVELKPSKLHKDLLGLPWKDVFTTNYDTLLERTAEQIIERKYEFVINKEKLIQSHSPRIIKLHGSFPANGPYIISEEDYRKYPQDNATLVNTVQQALIENTLCLVGFSGNDPNFLKWIGWIRDNLKDNMQPIYLIDYLDLDESKILLLEKRNIIPIDLAALCHDVSDYAKALGSVLEYLNSKNTKPDEWGRGFYVDRTEQEKASLCLKLKQQRLAYPGWIVVPCHIRERMVDAIRDIDIDLVNSVPESTKIQLAYEIAWLYRCNLRPLYASEVKKWRDIIDKYNPFPNMLKLDEAEYTPQKNIDWQWNEISALWIEIQLFLLKTYREYGLQEEWESLHVILEAIISSFNPEQVSMFQYELCLHYIYQFDIDGLKNQLQIWDKKAMSAKWRAKRAMLVGEFISTSEARMDLENVLSEIRKVQNLNPIRGNYSALSIEAYVLCALQRLDFSNSICSVNKGESRDISRKITARTKQLRRYNCDPWEELLFFEYNIRADDTIRPDEQRIPSFDLNRMTTNHSWDHDVKAYRLAIQYWQYIEETATFYRLPRLNTLPKQTTMDALTILRHLRPYAAGIFQVRYGNRDAVKLMLTRKYLAYVDNMKNAEWAFGRYLELMKDVSKRCNHSMRYSDTFIEAATSTLPEILSRLCCCVSFAARKQLLDVIATAYTFRVNYVGMKVLVLRLMRSFSEEEQELILPELIKMPFPSGILESRLEDCDPLTYLRLRKIHNQSVQFKLTQVYSWLAIIDNESDERREIAITRVQRLYNLGLLNNEQTDLFAKLLWKNIGENGFPRGLSYYYFYYSQLPYPKDVDPIELLQNYILSTPFDPDNGKSISMLKGNVTLWHNILATQDLKQFKWTSEHLNLLAKNVIDWWDKNETKIYKKIDSHMFGSATEEYRSRLKKLSIVISDILYPCWHDLSRESQNGLLRIAHKNGEYANSVIYLEAAIHLTDTRYKQVVQKISDKFISGSEDDINDACDSLMCLHHHGFPINKILSVICNGFAYNRMLDVCRPILQTLLYFTMHSYKFSSYDMSCIIFGLKNYLSLTMILDEDNELMTEDKLAYQIDCIHLAYYLQTNYTILEEHMAVVNQWIELTREMDFHEIQNVIADIEWRKAEIGDKRKKEEE